jgi:hypothetical protein
VRVRKLNDAAVRLPADYVLYWPQMNRRVDSNLAFARAAQLANQSACADIPWRFGLGGRPWTELPIFGTIMSFDGMKPNADIEADIRGVEQSKGTP